MDGSTPKQSGIRAEIFPEHPQIHFDQMPIDQCERCTPGVPPTERSYGFADIWSI